MSEFETKLQQRLADRADSLDIEVPPFEPSYVSTTMVSSPPTRTHGGRAALVAAAVVLVGGVAAIATLDRGDEAAVSTPAVSSPEDDSDPGARPRPLDESEDQGATIDGELVLVRDTPVARELVGYAAEILPDFRAHDAYEWRFEDETVSAFVELAGPDGFMAKLALYTVPNPAHAEILSADSVAEVELGPDSWLVTVLTPDGRQLALILIDAEGTVAASDDGLPAWITSVGPALEHAAHNLS